ncbi:replication initiation protein [Novosphingobium sp. KACC 22771]|uniref:replication initiation protein n=1 Tax=Novosphingobium sp. KACC 22771 TaxID=3025670 RepID=UPI00236657E4|nr:replication initiation protein [Novosphingobium sp. KACC 22771]WDF75300.1 replication initiation protein [Novosphingobium sp. KACC 22771]
MRVAATLARKGGDEFAKPGKLVEVRFVKGQSLSLTASRLLALMILTAGGDAWRDTSHKLRKADIRRGHKGNERIVDMLEELHRTLFAEDDRSWRGRKATKRFSLIESSWEEVEEGDKETGWIEWRFTPDARRLIQESQTYSVMNRQAVLGFRSAYALKLYEEGALRLHRRQPIWRVDILGLRAALGIDPDKYGDFAQLRRKVLTVAQSEIDQLAHYNLEWKEIRRGRAVAEVEFRFVPKDAPAQIQTVDELERHSSGRKARREGEVDRLAVPTVLAPPAPAISPAAARPKRIAAAPSTPWEKFPDGSLRYGTAEGAFRDVALRYGGGWDMDLIADAYRQQMGDRLGSLRGAKLEKSWRGFCEAFLARRGRP